MGGEVGGEEFIGGEGLLQLYKDLNVAMDDPVTIVFPYYCNMKSYVKVYKHIRTS